MNVDRFMDSSVIYMEGKFYENVRKYFSAIHVSIFVLLENLRSVIQGKRWRSRS